RTFSPPQPHRQDEHHDPPRPRPEQLGPDDEQPRHARVGHRVLEQLPRHPLIQRVERPRGHHEQRHEHHGQRHRGDRRDRHPDRPPTRDPRPRPFLHAPRLPHPPPPMRPAASTPGAPTIPRLHGRCSRDRAPPTPTP